MEWGKWQTAFRLMMPFLGLGTQTLKDGLVRGETSLLLQEATLGPPTLGPTPGRHLLALTLDRHLLALTPGRHLLVPTPDRHLLATTPDRHLLVPTLVLQHLLIPDQPTPDSQVGLGPTLVPAPLVSLLDH